ncbi:hypothetical protein LTR91_013061 [Friedmanniomyces endolithicus]|uniref:Uncharacterized protein n=1 Tax=Friedmanniomyces endolithicus TaxID=329885 RepID=A0AAN6QQ68_9PEZI|nr:hypothetical protein LTR59_013864 [Friedmanniomyces endolithicus]KAK0785296.1 hypothetical protein LTR38_012378 [Friedmanniomyces endolithicus]KAK0828304.1 hypothetical protein LTR03_016639 [Friedmanniomyces endolithicus]KAK0846884.1 hypothetical protein LTS02_014694 [Friedmanniomyces endolithicus]KAK0894244.1 hypothetical protein LTR02_012412 [Friedmanniomyces endolithicus]
MTRARGTPLDLTESWDDVHDDDDDDGTLYTKDDERAEMRDSYRSDARDSAPQRDMRSSRTNFRSKADDGDRRRSARLSVEPELRMPASPDAGRSSARTENLRASTPHFRLNNRSMTSDAGSMNGEAKMRASTPRMRLSQRSMTSDAGRFGAKVKDDDDDEDETTQPNVLWRRVLRPLLAYAFDVAGVLVFGAGFATNTINNALTPICRIPGASYLHLPFCPSPTTTELQGPAEFDKLVQAQSQFEDVLASTQVGANLPMDMKRSEASIRDLKHVVQYSTLPCRNELVFEFTGFIDTARQASQDLSKFNSRIGRAVDQILSTNRWTLSVIDGVSATEASRGALSRWATSKLNIFAPFQPVALSRDVLLDQYLRHTGAVEEQILTLITEAQALLNILDNLDGRLDVIASIATRDGIKIDDNKEELFAYLWTKLGGNRNTVAKLAQQSELLKEVGAYRRLAWAHVTTTIVRLQAIRNTLEDLRERVALPEVVGEKVPLEVHIESIRLGIERLEQQREAGRKIEAEGYARVMGRAGGGERREIGGKDGS